MEGERYYLFNYLFAQCYQFDTISYFIFYHQSLSLISPGYLYSMVRVSLENLIFLSSLFFRLVFSNSGAAFLFAFVFINEDKILAKVIQCPSGLFVDSILFC